jgi:hypothetical protein
MANKQPATKRDLADDLRICEEATPGPWLVDGDAANQVRQPNGSRRRRITCPPDADGINDAQFIAEARTGWPDAIQRAISVEAELPAARALLIDMRKRAIDAEKLAESMRMEIAYLNASKAELIRLNASYRAYAYFLRECLRNGVQIPYDYDYSAFKEVYGRGQTEDYEI